MTDHADINHSGIAGVGGLTTARKTSDQASTSTSFADVTELTFAVEASTNYRFRFVVFLVTSSTGEGYALSVNGPSGTYKIGGLIPTGAGSATDQTGVQQSGAAADTTGLNVTTGPGSTQPVLALIEGVVLVGGSAGTLALRVKAETGGANSVTVQTNSYGEIGVIA